MVDFGKMIVYFWVIPLGFIHVLSSLYRKILVKKILTVDSQTNKKVKFNLTKEFDKISIYIEEILSDSDNKKESIKQNDFKLFLNGHNLSKEMIKYSDANLLFLISVPVKILQENNFLEVKYKDEVPLFITIKGEIKKVRQITTLIIALFDLLLIGLLLIIIIRIYKG